MVAGRHEPWPQGGSGPALEDVARATREQRIAHAVGLDHVALAGLDDAVDPRARRGLVDILWRVAWRVEGYSAGDQHATVDP